MCRKYEVLAKECEDLKAEFSQFEQRDVRCREDLKMARVKAKKLEKQLEQEKKKVGSWPNRCFKLRAGHSGMCMLLLDCTVCRACCGFTMRLLCSI